MGAGHKPANKEVYKRWKNVEQIKIIMNFIDNRSKGEAQWNPLHKTMLYRKCIQFKQAGAPSRYGPKDKSK